MKIAFYSTKPYDRKFFEQENRNRNNKLIFFEAKLNLHTVELAKGFEVICCFINDHLDAEVLICLKKIGVKFIALRSAGYNNVDVKAAEKLRFPIVRVPNYSPYAIAEHAVTLILSLNRKVHRAHIRVRESDFSLNGLLGFDLHGKTVGVIGTGRIGAVFANIMHGFGCYILGHDAYQNPACAKLENFKYTSFNHLVRQSDIISLHCPLTKETHHIIDKNAISKMKRGSMLINTSRGGLIDTQAVIDGLKHGQIGCLGLDVYEEEEGLFFEDLSSQIIQDDLFARLQTFPNVLITSHQAFFTKEALEQIAKTTLNNIDEFKKGNIVNAVTDGDL